MNSSIDHQSPACTVTPLTAIPGREKGMGIDEVTARAGVSERLVRHCEARGLISHAPGRGVPWSGYKHEDVWVLRFIREAHVLGFGMNEAAGLLAVWQDMCRVRLASDDPAGDGSKPEARIDGHDPIAAFVGRLADALLADDQAECSILEVMLDIGARTGLVQNEIRAALLDIVRRDPRGLSARELPCAVRPGGAASAPFRRSSHPRR